MIDTNRTPETSPMRCGALMSVPGNPWDSRGCSHPAKLKIYSLSTKRQMYRCGVHGRRYKGSDRYEVTQL